MVQGRTQKLVRGFHQFQEEVHAKYRRRLLKYVYVTNNLRFRHQGGGGLNDPNPPLNPSLQQALIYGNLLKNEAVTPSVFCCSCSSCGLLDDVWTSRFGQLQSSASFLNSCCDGANSIKCFWTLQPLKLWWYHCYQERYTKELGTCWTSHLQRNALTWSYVETKLFIEYTRWKPMLTLENWSRKVMRDCLCIFSRKPNDFEWTRRELKKLVPGMGWIRSTLQLCFLSLETFSLPVLQCCLLVWFLVAKHRAASWVPQCVSKDRRGGFSWWVSDFVATNGARTRLSWGFVLVIRNKSALRMWMCSWKNDMLSALSLDSSCSRHTWQQLVSSPFKKVLPTYYTVIVWNRFKQLLARKYFIVVQLRLSFFRGNLLHSLLNALNWTFLDTECNYVVNSTS